MITKKIEKDITKLGIQVTDNYLVINYKKEKLYFEVNIDSFLMNINL